MSDDFEQLLDSDTPPSNWWRWPLVPLAGIAFGLVAYLCCFVARSLIPISWLADFVVPAIACCLFGHCFVVATYQTAPTAKRATTVVMISLLSIAAIWYAVANGIAQFAASLALLAIGLTIGCFEIREEKR